ncbi:probable glutathione S-transferase 7 [Aplysia californica]|uniref:glutathione transferase n=1 Tax=Aplysia californica TaxID=6500 RepID=A0ABM0JQD7_APLCA|nr:probable glutathione S-transferase 7 [Aplysia californica]
MVAKASAPFQQTPTLEVDGKVFAQSTAIASFLAREFGLHGKTNLESLEIDQWVNLQQDIIDEVRRAKLEKDPERVEEIWKNFKETFSPRFLQFFEDGLKQNGTGFLVGDRLTLADLVLFDVITGVVANRTCGLDSYPLVRAHGDKVAAIEGIRAWVESRPAL